MIIITIYFFDLSTAGLSSKLLSAFPRRKYGRKFPCSEKKVKTREKIDSNHARGSSGSSHLSEFVIPQPRSKLADPLHFMKHGPFYDSWIIAGPRNPISNYHRKRGTWTETHGRTHRRFHIPSRGLIYSWLRHSFVIFPAKELSNFSRNHSWYWSLTPVTRASKSQGNVITSETTETEITDIEQNRIAILNNS